MSEALRKACEQAIDTIGYYASVCGEDDEDTPAKQTQAALRAALAESEQEPVAWEWRWFDASPYTVTSGQWSEWERVKPRNGLCTVEDRLNEFRAFIANGQRYELRPLYTAPPRREPLTNEFKPDWDAVKAFQDAIAERDAVLRLALEVFEEVAQWESEGDPEHPASKVIAAIKGVLNERSD